MIFFFDFFVKFFDFSDDFFVYKKLGFVLFDL